MNHVGAQYAVAECHFHGRGVPRNYLKAATWYRRAAAPSSNDPRGCADAQYSLAVCFEQGKGVKRDMREATAWYVRAAEQGHALALREVGSFSGHGPYLGPAAESVPKDGNPLSIQDTPASAILHSVLSPDQNIRAQGPRETCVTPLRRRKKRVHSRVRQEAKKESSIERETKEQEGEVKRVEAKITLQRDRTSAHSLRATDGVSEGKQHGRKYRRSPGSAAGSESLSRATSASSHGARSSACRRAHHSGGNFDLKASTTRERSVQSGDDAVTSRDRRSGRSRVSGRSKQRFLRGTLGDVPEDMPVHREADI
jgi:hypothetical protein